MRDGYPVYGPYGYADPNGASPKNLDWMNGHKDASGSYQIYTMRSDGTRQRQLTRGAASFTPDWSR